MNQRIASTANGSSLRLAADIGGTFTDIAAFDQRTGKLTFGKALSTPQRLVEGIDAGVAKAGSDYKSAGLFLHGSTIAINTILERKGAKTALLITDGFRDIYEIGRINRPDAYNLFFRKHAPLVERHWSCLCPTNASSATSPHRRSPISRSSMRAPSLGKCFVHCSRIAT